MLSGIRHVRDRSLACTHIQMTRLYDEFGCDQCSICHMRPPLGWLYRCTQDDAGNLPISDFSNAEHEPLQDGDAQLYTLSPSIIRSAEAGDYTDEQLALLWKQKLEVRRVIQQARPITSSNASTASSSQYSLPTSGTASSHISADTDPDTDISQISEYNSPCRGPLEPIREVNDELENGIVFEAPKQHHVACNFKACHSCRPIYQQRTWQSLDSVLKDPYSSVPEHELSNRRISDVKIVKELGLKKTEDTTASKVTSNKRHSKTKFQTIVQHLLKDGHMIYNDTVQD